MIKLFQMFSWILFISVWFACSEKDQLDKNNEIDSLVNKYIELDKFNGSLLVIHNYKIIYERIYGIANPSTNEQLTPDHRFRLASVTKQFTGMGIMILKESSKLDYSDGINKYLPEFPYDGITIKHLLTHTSGLPDYGSLLDQYWDTTNTIIRNRKIANNYNVYDYLIKYHPPALFSPGEQYKYSNTGYNLLGLIIEKASGLTFQKFMKTKVFEPLEMTNTFVNTPDGILPDELRAHGFKINPANTGYLEFDWHYQNGMFGEGGIYTTAKDMYKYDQALYTNALVSQETLKEAYSPWKLNDGKDVNYGFGWSLIDNERGNFVAHGGGWVGFSTFFLRDYHHGNTIIQLTNRPGVRRGELAFAIYEILHGGDYVMPKGSIAEVMLVEMNKNNIEKALQTYYDLRKTKPEEYDFSENQLNSLGYQLLSQERYSEAIQIFKENIKLFPKSGNVYDSLAEAYMKSDNRELAIKYYQESIRLDPDNENAKKMLKDLKN
jgi:CubicO group peptidase (beta-lactamase class C family)